MRSVHRYASDAMVVTMLLHLTRYWAFDRMRGFRWFSWVTGIVLLWLVFAAGVNGYMLPWDKLAQFVTQASFEWFDWLPGFGGTLIRNFIVRRQRQRPPVLAARLHPHRRAAADAAADVGACAACAQGQHAAAAADRDQRRRDAAADGRWCSRCSARVGRRSMARGADAAVASTGSCCALYPLVYAWPIPAVWALVLGGTRRCWRSHPGCRRGAAVPARTG